MTYLVTPATLEDGIRLHCTLSFPDRKELQAAQAEPLQSLLDGIRNSHEPVAIWDKHGFLAAVAGVVPVGPGVGAPWMLCTDAAKTEPHAFVRQAREWVESQLKAFPILSHQVYRHNHAHIRLLKLLGFEVDRPANRSQLFLPFRQCAPPSL